MKNTTNNLKECKMWAEHDFSNTRPNKYAKKYAEGINVVLIEPGLMNFFPDKESNKR